MECKSFAWNCWPGKPFFRNRALLICLVGWDEELSLLLDPVDVLIE